MLNYFKKNITNIPTASIRKELFGSEVFFKQSDYLKKTKKSLSSILPDSLVYNVDSSEKKESSFFSKISKALYRILQVQASKHLVLPCACPKILGMVPSQIPGARKCIPTSVAIREENWKYQRKGIYVDGILIDVFIVGTPETFSSGRWTLFSLGNAQFYETQFLFGKDVRILLQRLGSNGLFFNYPGVGASQGSPIKQHVMQAYRAMLRFLEDEDQGIGAKQIIFYGHSIGGAMQAEGLHNHKFLSHIKYVAVKSRTFSSLRTIAYLKSHKRFIGNFVDFLVDFFHWELQTAKCSKQLPIPEIILQTANVKKYERLQSSDLIVDDNVILRKSALAFALLEDPTVDWTNKTLFGIPEKHNGDISEISTLVNVINGYL